MRKKNRPFKSEREAWETLRARGKGPRRERRSARRHFNRLFEHGHDTSIRAVPQVLAKNPTAYRDFPRTELLANIHPDAFALIAAHGLDCTPHIFGREMYRSPGQPEFGQCYLNAWRVFQESLRRKETAEEGMLYVEGIVIGAKVWPMLHAWNARGSRPTLAFDWTLYSASPWNRYLGVPFTAEEYAHVVQDRVYKITSFFHRARFREHEERLREVLAGRTPIYEKPAD